MRRRALAVVVVVLALGACQHQLPPQPLRQTGPTHQPRVETLKPVPTSIVYAGSSGPRVAFAGDSLGIDLEPYLWPQILGPYRFNAFSRWTSGFHDLRVLIQLQAATRPDIYVGELGTADAGSNHSIENIRIWLQQSMDMLRGVPCVVWLTVVEEGVHPWYGTDSEPRAAAINRSIRAYAAARENVYLSDWEATARRHPEFYQSDGLHLNGAGNVAMARAIRLAVDRCMTAQGSASPGVVTPAPAPDSDDAPPPTIPPSPSNTGPTTTSPPTTGPPGSIPPTTTNPDPD